jgi:hypothetical protein
MMSVINERERCFNGDEKCGKERREDVCVYIVRYVMEKI